MMTLQNKVAAFGRAVRFHCTLLCLHRGRFGRHLYLSGATTTPTDDTFVTSNVSVGELKGVGELSVVAGLTYYHYNIKINDTVRSWAVEHTEADKYFYKSAYENAMINWDIVFSGYDAVMEKLRNELDPKILFHAENLEIEFCQ